VREGMFGTQEHGGFSASAQADLLSAVLEAEASSESIDEELVNQVLHRGRIEEWKPHPVRDPKPRPSPSKMWCKSLCCAQMPFSIPFPMGTFLLVILVFLGLGTLFITLAWTGHGRFSIGGATVWAWSFFIAISWTVLFLLFAIFFTLRAFFLDRRYRWMKVTFYLSNCWIACSIFLWSCSEFGTVQLISTFGGTDEVIKWMDRIVWSVFVLSIFYILWTLLKKISISRIERDDLWLRLAELLWRERLLEELLHSTGDKQFQLGQKSVLTTERLFGSINQSLSRMSLSETDKPSMEEFDAWADTLLTKEPLRISVAEVMMAETDRARKAVRMTRLAVRLAHHVFKNMDRGKKGFLSETDIAESVGRYYAGSHMSLFDKNGDGKVDRAELIEVFITIFQDRSELKDLLAGSSEMGRILGSILAVFIGIIAVVIVLQIFSIDVGALLLPFLTLLLGLVFIFGSSIATLWASFIVIFLMRPFGVRDMIEIKGFPPFTITKMELLSSVGFCREGIQRRIPKHLALNTPISNWGRSESGRIVAFVSAHAVTRAQLVAFAWKMKEWCGLRREFFQRKTFSAWIDSYQGGDKCTMGMQVQLMYLTRDDLDGWRGVRTDFYFHVESMLDEVGIKWERMKGGGSGEVTHPEDSSFDEEESEEEEDNQEEDLMDMFMN